MVSSNALNVVAEVPQIYAKCNEIFSERKTSDKISPYRRDAEQEQHIMRYNHDSQFSDKHVEEREIGDDQEPWESVLIDCEDRCLEIGEDKDDVGKQGVREVKPFVIVGSVEVVEHYQTPAL